MDVTSDENIQDFIYLKNLQLSAVIGPDAWLREGKEQPVILSVRLKKDLAAAADGDDVQKTINYGTLCKDLLSLVKRFGTFRNLKEFNDILNVQGVQSKQTTHLEITTLLPKGMLRGEGGISLSSLYRRISTPVVQPEEDESQIPTRSLEDERLLVHDLKVPCIIGVNPHERTRKQTVVLNLKIDLQTRCSARDSPFSSAGKRFHKILEDTIELVEDSSYETVESLALFIARKICLYYPSDAITVSVEKPSALAFVEGAGVEITRSWKDFEN